MSLYSETTKVFQIWTWTVCGILKIYIKSIVFACFFFVVQCEKTGIRLKKGIKKKKKKEYPVPLIVREQICK